MPFIATVLLILTIVAAVLWLLQVPKNENVVKGIILIDLIYLLWISSSFHL